MPRTILRWQLFLAKTLKRGDALALLMLNSVHFPFSPSKFPFFYGWVIVATATASFVASIPGQTIGVGVFSEPLMGAFGIGRVDLTLAYLVGTVGSSLALPLAGAALDRLGARRSIVIASLSLAATLVALSVGDHVRNYLVEVTGGDSEVLAVLVLALGFFAVRFWGQGVLTMIPRVLIGRWFNCRRGLASGIAGVVTSGAFAAAPGVLKSLNDAGSWRSTWQLFAGVVGLGMATMGWLFYRDTPEECGLTMDGRPPPTDSDDAKAPEERHFTLREVCRSYSFWVINGAIALHGLVGTAMTFHIVALSRAADVPVGEEVRIFLPMAVVSVCTNLFCGWLSDRCELRYLVLLHIAAVGVGTAGLLSSWLGSTSGYWTVVVFYGIAGGLFPVLTTVTWPRFYGRRHLGAISSLHLSMIVFASALGPFLFASSERYTESFDPALLVSAAAAAAVWLAAFGVRNPQRGRRVEGLLE